MPFRVLFGRIVFAAMAVFGLVGFFALLLVFDAVLSPLGLSQQTVGWIAAGTFFVGFWAAGLKLLFG